jgi:hypothetical protein
MANCLSGTNCHITPTAGEGLIFRGGDTWHFGNPGATPYAGLVTNCDVNQTQAAGLCLGNDFLNGSSGSPVYVGTDPTWSATNPWSRPIFTADNPLTPHPGLFGDSVVSCAYQIGASNKLVSFEGAQYAIFDDFELTGLCQQTLNDAAQDTYLFANGGNNNMYTRLYVHGWTHLPFSCSGDTGLCFNLKSGIQSGGSADLHIQDVVDGSDSDPAGLEALFTGGYNVYQSVFRYTAQVVANGIHLWHDNLMEHWFCPGDSQSHPNLLETGSDPPGTNAIYNNVFRSILTDPGSCPINSIVGIWLDPPAGSTDYIFNNVWYNTPVNGIEYINVGQNANGGDEGPEIYFNNTFEDEETYMFGCAQAGFAEPFTTANNHYIFDSPSPYTSSCAGQLTPVTNLLMTHAIAASDGYTVSETFPYSPTSANSPTAGAGTNEQAFCNALAAAAQSDPTLSDAATACQSDTRYACTYNSMTHTVTCPARIPVARPTNSSWDIGAYQYCPPSQCTQSPPPTTTTSSFSPQVYPNPWRSDRGYPAQITFDQLTGGNTTIKIFSVAGHLVKTLSTQNSGLSTVTWNLINDYGDKVASGIYLYLITDSQGDKVTGKVAVIK